MMIEKRNKIYISSLEVSGIKNIYKKEEFDFSPSKSREYLDNAEFWGLEREKYTFGALKSIFLIGENSTGKSSVLEAIFMIMTFLKNPNLTLEQMRHLDFLTNYNSRMNGEGIKWSVDFVTKFKGKVYKITHKAHLIDGNVRSESLSYIWTTDGKKISNRVSIFKAENNRILFGNGKHMWINIGNALMTLISTQSDIKEDMINEGAFTKENFEILQEFSDSVSGWINRGASDEQNEVFAIDQIKSKKMREKILALYQLFDKKLVNIKTINKEWLFEYEISKGKVISLPLHTLKSYISSGASRMLDLIVPIFNSHSNNSILLLDELDKSLHLSLAEFLTAFIMDFNGGQVFIATHNLAMLDSNKVKIRSDQVYILTNDKSKNKRGDEIAKTLKEKFVNEYLKTEYLSTPNEENRSKLYELYEEN